MVWPLPSCPGTASLVAQIVKNLPAIQETWIWSLGQEDPLEKGTATHSSILAWRIPRTEEPNGLQSMGSQRVWHDWVLNTHFLSNFLLDYTPQALFPGPTGFLSVPKYHIWGSLLMLFPLPVVFFPLFLSLYACLFSTRPQTQNSFAQNPLPAMAYKGGALPT